MKLGSFFKRKTTDVEVRETPVEVSNEGPTPSQPIFVVGDLHGRADLLELMLAEIDGVIGAEGVSNPLLCFVGNAIDHGPESKAVLIRLKELTDEFPDNVAALMGNHEQMLLDVLAAPEARHARWLRDGGDATCRSFGLPVEGPDIRPEDARRLADTLRDKIGDDLCGWLQARPVRRTSGNLSVVHAGADPVRPMDEQTDRVMIWGHPEFMTRPRIDRHWVAHGHYVVERPAVSDGRISVNTEAWKTGVLSGVFVSVSAPPRMLQVHAR